MLQDFPFTGIGMGTFTQVADRLYPFFLYAPGTVEHAHNLFLQVGVDLGLPGLIAWLAIFMIGLFSGFPRLAPGTGRAKYLVSRVRGRIIGGPSSLGGSWPAGRGGLGDGAHCAVGVVGLGAERGWVDARRRCKKVNE